MSHVVDSISAAYNIIIFIIAFFGNITTIIVILLFKDLKSTTNYYILNLAVADLLLCITAFPGRLILLFSSSLLTCKFNTFAWIFFFNASVFAIFSITVDRYIFICKPLYYCSHIISTRSRCWISFSWLLAVFLAILPFINIPYLGNQNGLEVGGICAHRLVIGRWYLFFLIMLTEIFPLFLFCLMYGKIVTVARKHAFEIAIQYSKSKPLNMSWQERRRFTQSLVSPFENPSCLLEEIETESDEVKNLRRILYANNYCCGDSVRKDTAQQGELVNVEELHPHSKKLSEVGRNLREWRRRAMKTSVESGVGNCEQVERDANRNDCLTKRQNRNRVSPIESGASTKQKSRRVTEQCRPVSRPRLKRSLSLGTGPSSEDSKKLEQFVERRNEHGKSTAKNSVGPFIVQKISKLSWPVRKKNRLLQKPKIYKEFKAVKMLGMVVGMFVLLNLPIAIIDLIELFARKPIVPEWIVRVALHLVHSNPAVNTVIYVVTKREFRYAFLRLWTCGRIHKRLWRC